MKKHFREKIILFLAQVLAKPVLLIYRSTLKIRIINRKSLKSLEKRNLNIIFCFWHENMILPLLVHKDRGAYVMVSQHFDGEVIARILRAFGLLSVRGSSTRGGQEAYLEMKSKLENDHHDVAFTPDGPRGPRNKVKPGVVRLGCETGIPILPIGVAANSYRRLKSWDRFLFIFPFSRCVLKYGQPIILPDVFTQKMLTQYAHDLAVELNRLDKEAETCLSC